MRKMFISPGRLAFLIAVLICSASMSFYWTRYTIAVRYSLATSKGLHAKPLTDFYPSWYATREFLLHRQDPYGAAINRQLQFAFYGKELDSSKPEEQLDQQRFVYPLYFMAFVAPVAPFDFDRAKVAARSFLVICAALSVFLWLRFLRLQLSWSGLTILFALVLTSVPVLQNLTIIQPFLLPACFLAAAAATVASGNFFLSGAMLALSTVKPQISMLPVAWFALWIYSDWTRRRSLFWGFALTLFGLLTVSLFVLPGWLFHYPKVLREYAKYTKAASFEGTLFPGSLHWLLTFIIVAAVTRYCWRTRKESADSPAFATALALVLTMSVFIIPAMAQPLNHVLLLPVVLLTIKFWRPLRQGNLAMKSGTVAFPLFTIMPWIFAAVAVSRPLSLDRDWLLKVWSYPLASSMALPFAAFGMLILLRHFDVWPAENFIVELPDKPPSG